MQSSRLLLTVLLVLGVAAPARAQLRATRPPRPVQSLPRLFVANPYVYTSIDSTAAVRVGDGIRKRMDNVAGRWFVVVSRDQMNEALLKYAYPTDAVLAPMVARTLANTLQAQVMVSGTMTKGDNNRFTAAIRVIGMNDKAGHLITLDQASNQSLEEFGEVLANNLKGAFSALPDARECWGNQIDKVDKAISSARKALNAVPNHGFAEYCLGEIHLAMKSPADSIIHHFHNAATGDSLSLEAWSMLAIQYQTVGDSNLTVETFKQMLRIAPTNQVLREQAFKLFLAYDRANEALNVANEGIEQDPTNPDLYDLKANACVFLDDYPCSIDALEHVYTLDPEKADSAYFVKIAVFADQQPDTARLLKWAKMGVEKFPEHPQLLNYLVKAYSYAGPLDSLVTTTRRYLAVDSSDVTPALVAIQGLAGAKRFTEATLLGALVVRVGDESAKSNYAGILLTAVQPLVSEQPPPFEIIADLTRLIASATTNTQYTNTANLFRGFAVFNLAVQFDEQIVAAKSCERIPELEAMLAEAGTSMRAGQSVSLEFATQYLKNIDGYPSRIVALRKAYCK